MSGLQFIAALIQALAWPAIVLVVVILFRKEITGLLSAQMKRLKAGPFEVEWDRQLSETEVNVDQALPIRPTIRSPGGLLTELADMARTSPSAAVLKAHQRVEQELRLLLENLPSEQLERLGAAGLARLARDHGLITSETLRALEGITVLRNLVVHGKTDELTPDKAMDYLSLVDAVLFALRTPAS